MPLVNALPQNVFPGNPWSSTAPNQALELITTYNLDEKDALNAAPGADLAWAGVGSNVGVGVGIVKHAHALPQSLAFEDFKIGARHYNTVDVVTAAVAAVPKTLNFEIPMVWNSLGNGWELRSMGGDGSLIEFLGISGLGASYVVAGRHLMAQLVASLFYEGLYASTGGLSILTPKALTWAQPNNPNGIALFTDGTGAEGTAGAMHYANPTMANSGRYKNVWFGFGSFETAFGASLVKMSIKPHATLPNVTSGAKVTDVIGPTSMREKFWRMMVSDLTLQTAELGGNGVAAATSNPFTIAKQLGVTEENFVGNAFGPRRFWIAPQLDDHPYMVAHPTADFWINICAGKDSMTGQNHATWAKLACNNKDFAPTFLMYGPGDPLAMNRRMMRFEGDLDAGVRPGHPGVIDMFGSV